MADDDRQAALNAIDLKGNIVLKEFGDTALLFRPQNNYEPFVVAYGYDKAAGEWSHGSYHTDLGHAFEEANPEIIEDACVRWQRGDIATALGNEEYPATDANVSWILNRSTLGDFHEEMTAKGNERLGEIVHEQERYLDKASGKNLAASEGAMRTCGLACLRPTTGRSGCRIWSMSFAKAPEAHRAMRFRGTSRMAGKLSSRTHI